MPIYQVTITKECEVWIDADDEQEATDDAAWMAGDLYEFKCDTYAYERDPTWDGEWVETRDGPIQWKTLKELREWIDAVEAAADAPDPNQMVMFDV